MKTIAAKRRLRFGLGALRLRVRECTQECLGVCIETFLSDPHQID